MLWAFQVRFPPLSYPALGQICLLVLTAILLFGAARLFRKMNQAPTADARQLSSIILRPHPALIPGMLFLAWNVARWLIAGAPADSTADMATPLWAAAYFMAALVITPAQGDGERKLPCIFLKLLCLIGLACGVYAIFQYHISYQSSYDALLRSIGNRPPDRTEAALLHHLDLRRVASFWGDPNSYAAFAALGIAASIEVIATITTWRLAWRVIAACSILAGLAGIFYTGSRGGVLDVLLVLAFFAILFVSGRFWRQGKGAFAVTALVFGCMAGARSLPADSAPVSDPQTTAAPAESGWMWRSDTIRERIYSLQVGARMIALSPVIGLGPGSVNDYFGRLKSPNAREARHLHNWFINVWAELGAVGVSLLCWFLGAIAWKGWRTRILQQPIGRTYLLLFGVLVFDGLLQTSWAQRELMSLFGLVCGCLVGMTAESTAPAPVRVRAGLRASALACIAAVMLLVEVPFLSAANAKQIAEDAMLSGDSALASRYWEKASRWAPRDPEPYQGRAQIALSQGQLSAARLLYQRALELSPESASLNVQLAAVLNTLSKPVEAERHFRRAMELYPSNPAYNFQYGMFLAERGRREEALKFAQRAAQYSYLPEEKTEINDFLQRLR
jgi:Flp pilus assembly protein TadD